MIKIEGALTKSLVQRALVTHLTKQAGKKEDEKSEDESVDSQSNVSEKIVSEPSPDAWRNSAGN